MRSEAKIKEAAEIIKSANRVTAFTGAGISVESGIPPFRGEKGLWNKYNPSTLDINFFMANPKESWEVIKEIFYDFFGTSEPNMAHDVLAWMEQNSFLEDIITQNIDNLHQEAGSKIVYEFHGNSKKIICLDCGKKFDIQSINLDNLPPRCDNCDMGLLKPDFIFFGEGIPPDPMAASYKCAEKSDVFLIIGTTGEVMPACSIPIMASRNGAKIIEINPQKSNFTNNITDLFLQGKASEIMEKLKTELISS